MTGAGQLRAERGGLARTVKGGRTTSALTTSPSRNDSMILILSFSVSLH